MKQLTNHLINDSTQDFDKEFLDVINPSTGCLIAKVGCSDINHINYALNCTYEQFTSQSKWLTLAHRIEILDRVTELMGQESVFLAKTIAEEGGKPLVDAEVEANRAIQGVKKCIESISRDAGKVVPMGMYPNSAERIAFTQKEPIGVVLAISAFNHPLNLIVHQVAAAIAAGCPCIVKPAPDTPLSCLKFYELLLKAGLPKDYLHVIITDNIDLAGRLVKSNKIQFLSFIGSARVGWMLRQQVQPGVRCALEHGGAAPVIVTENANLSKAVAGIAKGGFYHAGQVCVSTQRVFVERSVCQEFTDLLKQVVLGLKVGDACDNNTDVGPLIREHEVKRVDSWVKEAIEQGAELICGGAPIDNRFYAPTILLNPNENSKVSYQEIFGPVVCIYDYDSLDDALEQANSLEYIFQAGVFSDSLDECMYIYRLLKASAVMINDHSAFREDGMPFAGLKQSGLAVGGIHNAINDMQIEKLMVIKS